MLSRLVMSHSVTPWTAACQAPLSMGIILARILEGVAYPSPADLADPGIELGSPAWQADSLPTELSGKPQDGYSSSAGSMLFV